MGALTTSTAIKQALAEDYLWLAEHFDPKYRERQATPSRKRRLSPWQCAACGRSPPEVERLEAAHIEPLAECAKTKPENLVLLCKDSREPPDCHALFDAGCASINKMHLCRDRWARDVQPALRDEMLLVFKQHGPCPQQQGHLAKEFTRLRERQKALAHDSQEWHTIQLHIAEVTRRRSRTDALKRALSEIERVDPRVLPEVSLYHYERGYINLLLGNRRQASSDFDDGRSVLAHSAKIGDRWRWAAHTALVVQVNCMLRAAHPQDGQSWNWVRSQLEKALEKAKADLKDLRRIKETSPESELRNASRWVYNCMVHLLKPDLAQGRVKRAAAQWRQATKYWRTMDLTNGWDAASRPTNLALYGQIAMTSSGSEEEIKDAMAYLVRALVMLLGLRRRQPEGVRDLLFAISDGLRRLGERRHLRVKLVAGASLDYSSWFNPSVPIGNRE